MYSITQEDIRLLKQREKEIYVKIEVKDKDFKTLDEVSGVCTSFSYDISSDSGIRRSANLSVYIKEDKFNSSYASLFWIDKIIYISVGYKNMRTGEVAYYPVAHFFITENSLTYDAVTKELNVSLVDLMAMFTGERGGYLVGSATKVLRYGSKPVEEASESDVPIKIRNAIVDTVVQLGEWTKYRIDDVGYDIPYDIEFGAGVTVFEIINELVNLYPAWEFFFDEEGTFICQEIPTCVSDSVILDDSILSDLIISEPYSNSFSNVYNITEVFGRCLETDYFCDSVTLSGSQYNAKLDVSEFVYQNGKYYGFTVPANNKTNPTLKINSLETYPILNNDDTTVPAGTMLAGQSYVVKFSNKKFYYQGQYQIHAIATLWAKEPSSAVKSEYKTKYNCNNMSFIVNEDNRFAIDYIGPLVNETIEDDAIFTDKDCLERAEYENWMTTVLSNQVSMEIVSIPWLDVNKKIEHKLELRINAPQKDSNSSGMAVANPKQYIIKNISNNVMAGTMSVEMINFYPLYPYITTKQALENSKKSRI